MPTITELLASHPDDALAIGAPEREWLTYGDLRAQAARTAADLAAAGVTAGNRVAIVLANGPDMASAFVTVAQAATTAPLNPAYRQEEFEFYLDDLKAKAIILVEGYDGPALPAARKFGLTVLRLKPEAAAGAFSLAAEGDATATEPKTPVEDDIALILHTSGTTSRPKIVPLLQSN
ncbi:MAG: AMP-binding protein, partial [Pseudomonadota bacterium]